MNFIIAILVAAKGMVFFTGLLPSNMPRPALTAPRVGVIGDTIFADCAIIDAFPPELAKLAQTGTEILIYLVVEIHDNGNDKIVSSATTGNSLAFDMIARHYTITLGARPDTLHFSSLDSAMAAWANFPAISLCPRQHLRSDKGYYMLIYAVLGKSRVEALEGRTIDLMYFWNYRRPALKTEPLRGLELLGTAHSGTMK